MIFLASEPKTERIAELHRDLDGHLLLEAWQPGRYELPTAAGLKAIDVPSLPEALTVAGPWEVSFPPHAGAPEKATFNELISWSQHTDPGIKYFSGAATYSRSFALSPGMLGHSHRVYLDLGKVDVMAHVTLNGKDLGIVWKPPYLVDISEAAQPGSECARSESRQPLDQPDDRRRATARRQQSEPGRHTQAVAAVAERGQAQPDRRTTFTTWRLWKKGDALVPSGLLGPVKIVATERIVVE